MGQTGTTIMTYEPDMPKNTDDFIDSRDVIYWIDALTELEDDESGEVITDEQAHDLRILRALAENGESVEDWAYGETLIHDAYFETYAREMASDIGAINEDAGWPAQYIDWERAADALQQDYTEVDFDGQTYWAR